MTLERGKADLPNKSLQLSPQAAPGSSQLFSLWFLRV